MCTYLDKFCVLLITNFNKLKVKKKIIYDSKIILFYQITFRRKLPT